MKIDLGVNIGKKKVKEKVKINKKRKVSVINIQFIGNNCGINKHLL